MTKLTLRSNRSKRVQVEFKEPTMTKQSFRDECNINTIMSKYRTSGLVTHVNKHQGQYGDFSDLVDYQTALNVVMNANEMFMTLPSQVRSRFENDPAQFLNFVNDESNIDEMRDLGLLKEQVVEPKYIPIADLPEDKSDQKTSD